jgi:uncharacterized phage-associated protein
VEKAIEVLLYVAERVPDTYTALKILYFADKDHLAKYGRLISGDSYVAMRLGPVPSGTYDLVKHVRGNGFCWIDMPIPISEVFSVQEDHTIILHRKANCDLLSESDIECLDAAIEKYGHLSFGQLKRISHNDDAWKRSDQNDFIQLETIAKTLPDGDLLVDYLRNG